MSTRLATPVVSAISAERIERAIYLIRGQKVMDVDLAELYVVETRVLTRAVRRNLGRFPRDFAFVLTEKEFTNLKSQIGISSSHGGRRKPPFAFTEQGVAMLSSVLRSKRAIHVNIEIVRTFVRLRSLIAAHRETVERLTELEKRCDGHDHEIQAVFDVIRRLMDPPSEKKRKRIGFTRGERKHATGGDG